MKTFFKKHLIVESEKSSNDGLATWTTLTVMRREKGRVAMIRRMEIMVMRCAQMPGPSSHAARKASIELFMD